MAEESFKTKLELYIFDKTINEIERFSLREFINFEITEFIAITYSAQYCQVQFNEQFTHLTEKTSRQIHEKILEVRRKNKKRFLKFNEDYLENRFSSIFCFYDFAERMVNQPCCEYCYITEEDMMRLECIGQLFIESGRTLGLELQRKDKNYEFTLKNTVKCCHWCNNAKKDEFSHEEFKKIGRSIRSVWNKRLNKYNN